MNWLTRIKETLKETFAFIGLVLIGLLCISFFTSGIVLYVVKVIGHYGCNFLTLFPFAIIGLIIATIVYN